MWLKRFLILVPTPRRRTSTRARLTPGYTPTWVEWAITAGGFAGFMLLYTLFSRIFPIVSIWEVAEDGEEAEHVAEKAPRGRLARPSYVPIRVLMLAAGLGASATIGAERAEAQSVQPGSVQVALSRQAKEDEDQLVATVTVDGRPLNGARVAFSVARTFSPMALGEEVTGPDGKAFVPYPSTLPGGPTGELAIAAEIVSPDRFAGVRGEAAMPGARAVHAEATSSQPPRALWSSRAPLGVIISLSSLLAIVWSTYVFVIRQLVNIKKDGAEKRPVYVR
jgi:hypothetical protein